MKTKEEIKKRIEEIKKERNKLSLSARYKLNRMIKELEWVLDE